MKYLVIGDNGYEGYAIDECETKQQAIDSILERGDSVHALYKIEFEIDIKGFLLQYQGQRKEREARLTQSIRSKLTTEELEFMGLKP